MPPATFGASEAKNIAALTALATAMKAPRDLPKDGPDDEESAIPALYTYFGQFIDHDITFDPASSLMKANDPDALVDFRTPALDLDNLYGRGPSDQPYMYDGNRALEVGEFLQGDGAPPARDLPRFKGRALIGDPRNDENSIVSQLQGLFYAFHNRMCADNPSLPLSEVQRLVRFHYQYVLIHDYLPRLISRPVLDALKSNGHYAKDRIQFYKWRNLPFMPVEFSVAAFRLGHSMIRPGYRLNNNDAMLLPIFPTAPGEEGLTGFRTMRPGRAIDWGRFIDIEVRAYDGDDEAKKRRLQLAYRIDTSIAEPLANLPAEIAGDPPPSLALRNLERAWRFGLPSGQVVARKMGVPVLADDDIVFGSDEEEGAGGGEEPKTIAEIDPVFAGNCPLWTYILAEAVKHAENVPAPVAPARSIETPKLGPVGGRIIAEVFLGMLFGDGRSLLSLNPSWVPRTGPNFALRDIVRYALGEGPALG
ncbi:MAG TPA: heme peroxidase family protein [Allosphingosinicella sp.]